MKIFTASLLLNLKRHMRRISTLAILLCLPLLVVILGLLLPATGGEKTIIAGVLLPENDPAAAQFMQQLEKYSTSQLRFEQAESRPQLENKVAGGEWECAYILASDFGSRVQNVNLNGMFICVTSPASTLNTALNWSITASLLDISAPEIAARYLDKSGILSQENQQELDSLIDKYFVDNGQLDLEIRQISGVPLPEGGTARLTGALLARGLIALVLFLFSWLCAVHFSEDLASGFFIRLTPYVHPAELYFSAYTAATLLSALAGGLSVAAAGIVFPGWFGSPLLETASLLFYLFLLAGFSFLLSVLISRRDTLIAALPFALIACLLLSPVLVDISLYLPAAGYAALLLPPTYYLRAVGGSPVFLWIMSLLGTCLLAVGLLLQKLRNAQKMPIE